MDIYEILLPPFYFGLIVIIALQFRNKQRAKNKVYEHFMPGLLIKMFGAVALGLTYFLYYAGGDTINYYYTACSLVDLLLDNYEDFFYIYFGDPKFSDYAILNSKYEFTYWINDEYAFFVCKCFTPIVLICGESYFASAIVVATICYIGVWRLFLVFVQEFPHLKSLFVWSILYVPSVVFWGSGLMKDSITFSSACLYVHGFYWFFTQKKYKLNYILALILGAYLLISIKPYILFALLPGSILWFLVLRMTRIKSVLVKIMFAPALIVLGITVGLYSLQQLGDSLGKYSMDKVIKTASGAQQDLKQSYYGGNTFDIGDYDPSPAGMLSVSHKAIFAALFRPTLIDVRNVVMFLCRWFEVMRYLLADPTNAWWDDTKTSGTVETRDDMLKRALTEGIAEMQKRFGDDTAKWRWGAMHTLTLTNQTFGSSGIKPIEMLFNRGPIEVSGSGSVVNSTGWRLDQGYTVDWLPSMRQVLDLSNWDNSTWVHLTGQSGHAYSAHYVDQVDAWVAGKTFPWPFTSTAVSAATVDTLIMKAG